MWRGTIEPAMLVIAKIPQKDGYQEHADWKVPLLKSTRGRYSILERVPVYPDDHKVEPLQEMKEKILEDKVSGN